MKSYLLEKNNIKNVDLISTDIDNDIRLDIEKIIENYK